VVHRAAVFMRGVDVEKAELVRPGSVIGIGRLDRIAGVDQVDEVHALDDAAVGHVEAGDDAGLEHGSPLGSTRGLAKRRVSGLPCGMVKLVLLHRADSIYDDEPDREYDFPRDYLRAAEDGVGDWIVYSEPVKAGPRGYFAVARIERIIPNPRTPGRFLALIEPGSYLEFDRPVSRLHEGRPMESALTYPDGRPKPGGLTQSSVRRLPECEFAAIVSLGLPAGRSSTWRSAARCAQPTITAVPSQASGCARAAAGPRYRRPISDQWRGRVVTRSGTASPCR